MTKVELSNELQQRLVTVLDYLGDTAKHGADLAAKELPEVANEIVLLGMVRGWMGLGLGVVLIAFAAWALQQNMADWRRNRENGPSIGEDPIALLIAGAVAFAVGLGVGIPSVLMTITATFAPRVYLIEWVADKMK